jgi:hypothetical protein
LQVFYKIINQFKICSAGHKKILKSGANFKYTFCFCLSKNMNKKILLILPALLLLLFPALVFGQTLGSMAAAIASQVVIVGRWIVVIMWIVTGVLFLSALGDPGKLNTAKMALFAAIGGTIIIIIASSAESFVRNSFNL